MTRSGTHAAWILAIGFESAFVMFGLFRFFTSRYLGGTLFAIVKLGVLLHPAVARAFSGVPQPAEGHPGLRDANGEPFGGRASGLRRHPEAGSLPDSRNALATIGGARHPTRGGSRTA